MRVALHADFSRYTGYGNDAIDIALALDRAGVDVLPMPNQLTPGVPVRFAQLLTKDPLKPRPDVLLVFQSPGALSRARFEPTGLPVVVYTMWEWDRVLEGDFMLGEYDLSWLADLIVTCPMNVEAFAGCFPGRDIGVVPAGVDLAQWDVGEREPLAGRPTRFLMAGVLSERKNPYAVLEAWRDLKAEHPEFDAELHVHSMGRNLHPRIEEVYGPGVTLSERRLSTEEMREMYARTDVLVTASRGEGNNKPAMEFMASGGPVIASDWSGHQNFMHRDVGWLVGGKVVEAPNGAGWFEVDGGELRAATLEAATEPGTVVTKGRLAKRHIAAFTWDAAADRLIRRLEAARGR